MRSILACAFVLVLCAAVSADIPETVSYQGVLRDLDGDVVSDGTYSVDFALYDVQTAGTALWTETQSVEVEDGIFNVILGSSTALDLAFDVQYWLGIDVESAGELTPRVQLTSAPYALRAAVADSVEPTAVVDDGDWESQGGDVWHDGNVGIGTGATNPSYPLEVTGDAYFYNDINVTDSSILDKLYVYDVFYHYNGDYNLVNGSLNIYSGELRTPRIHPYATLEITDTVTPFLVVDTIVPGVGIGTWTPGYLLDVAGTLNCTAFRLPTGASSGRVLTSDGGGNATWQALPLESGRFECSDDYALLVDCNGAQLKQNGSRNTFRIYSNVGDSSVCYAHYQDGVIVSKAVLASSGYYDFTVPAGVTPYHVEVVLSRPWAGGAVARVDISYQNGRCGGVWNSSH